MQKLKTIFSSISLPIIVITILLAFYYTENPKETPLQKPVPTPNPDIDPTPTPPVPPKLPELKVFSAKWCSACQRAKSYVDQIEQSGIKVIRIDADKQPQLLREYSVTLLPTFILCNKNGCFRTNNVQEIVDRLKDK
jgi:thiol-disulfide isomerase/thioredoxin